MPRSVTIYIYGIRVSRSNGFLRGLQMLSRAATRSDLLKLPGKRITSEILIELETPTKHFHPGDRIAGRVVMFVHKPYDVRDISIIFEGSGTVSWSTRESNYAADEIYLFHRIHLLGNGKVSGESTLRDGTHFYPFEYVLPDNLPSSYQSTGDIEATIDYFMEARTITPTKANDNLIHVTPFKVNGILDLNQELGACIPILIEKYKTQGCLCCKSGHVGFTIDLPQSGFIPGELVTFHAEVTNRSRRKVNSIVLRLVQTINVSADEAEKSTSEVICEVKSPGIDPGTTILWGDKSDEVLKIPEVPPTRLATCKIIDIEYSLQFQMDIHGIAANVKAQVPIIIGTVPCRKSGQPQSSLSLYSTCSEVSNNRALKLETQNILFVKSLL